MDDLVRDLQEGRNETENFHAIFERYYGSVFRFFERNGLRTEDSRDLTQDVFFAAYRSIKGLREPGQFTAWLFCIARNTLRNEIDRRRTKKRLALEVRPNALGKEGYLNPETVPDQSQGGDVLGRMMDHERLEMLIAVLGDLPVQMRRCVHLRVVEESSYEEIATIMGISLNTVKAHIHQAKKLLKKKLLPYFGNIEV